ncbi:MAG: PAS domain-containing protein [Ignavibacteriales bacterium]|nr:PAS domain-containing protein [Ignavibacteriales bacterium]
MQNQNQIESFFNSLKFNWSDLIEFLPIGMLFFDSNWKIKSVNSALIKLFENMWLNQSLVGMNLFSRNFLSEKLPLQDILLLREGKHFEKKISFINKENIQIKIAVKGSPIVKDNVFHGGTLIIEEIKSSALYENIDSVTSNSIIDFLEKICSSFIVCSLDGNINFVSEQKNEIYNFINNKVDKNITDVFNSESITTIKSSLNRCIQENKPQEIKLNTYSEIEKFNFNAVFIPLNDLQNNVTSIIILLREINKVEADTIGFLTDSVKLKEFESFAKINSDGLFKINLYGNITFWSENAADLFGLNEAKILDKFIGEIFPEVNNKYFESIRSKIISNGSWEGYLTSNKILTDDIIKVKIISQKNAQETNLFVYCDKIDLQQQKIISAREEEKIFFKDAVIKSDQMILQANPNGIILFANEKFCTHFEYELDEIRGKQFLDFVEYEFKERNGLFEFDELLNCEDFEIIPLKNRSENIIDACFSINISTSKTELKYFTIYIHECDKKDKMFLETAYELLYQFNEPVLIINDDQIIKVNSKFCELFGSQFESDYHNLESYKIISKSSLERFYTLLSSSAISKLEAKIEFVKKDKTTFSANVKKICCAKESSFSVLIIKTEKEYNPQIVNDPKPVESFEGGFDQFRWTGFYKNNELIIESISKEFVSSIGFAIIENYSFSTFWFDIIHPDDIEKFNSELKSHFESGQNNFEIDYRIINNEGKIIWLNNKLKFVEIQEGIKISGLLTDITNWIEEKEELKSIIAELDKLNIAKEKFISIISHDLKSPFTSIVGFSDLILTDSSLDKDEIIEYVGHIKDASLHTVDLLNGLLDLTKLQTGRIEVEPKIVNAHFLTNKTVEILSGLAYQKGLTLKADVDSSIFINVDENLIFQVFNNLVANSIKFTPKGGSIEISARKSPDHQKIEFTVKDTGVGIEKEDIDKLFVLDKKFTTLGTDGERGTGLGLSLVKEIIDKHNGKISVKSELNKGSEFIFTLPISSPSILIVDSVKAERILYSRLLASITKSIRIIQSANVEEALKFAKEEMPMLIIFEHSLSNMNGFDFIEELNKSELVYKPSLIVLTKEYSEELKKSYKNLGIYDVFAKPFALKEFKSKIDSITGNID